MKLKRHLRTALESAAYHTGLLARFERRARAGLTILTYHRVLEDAHCANCALPALAMPRSAFRAQMEWLANHFELLPVGEAWQRHGPVVPATRARNGRALASITFDDGYVDNAEVVAPILDGLGIRATFFVVTEFVATGNDLWFDRAARLATQLGDTRDPLAALEPLKRMGSTEREKVITEWTARVEKLGSARRAVNGRSAMTRDQLASLVASGHEIGSHTLGHPVLTHLDDAGLDREVGGSKRELESWLGVPVHGFAYPNGDHDERVRASARRAGYRFACTTADGLNEAPLDPLALQRIDVTPARVSDHAGTYAEIAFRSQISLMRSALRGAQ